MKTGIEGLDILLGEGIPQGSQVLLAGGPGAGKTLLGFEFLYRNAKLGNKCVFFALEEDTPRIIENAKAAFSEFKDIDQLMQEKKLLINSEDLTKYMHDGTTGQYEFGKIVSEIEYVITESGASVMVLDSMAFLNVFIAETLVYRRSVISLINNLRRLGVTSLFTFEIEKPDRRELTFMPEFFLFDGIISMYQTGEEARRMLAMEVIKLRGSKHSFVTAPYEITPRGFNVISSEEM